MKKIFLLGLLAIILTGCNMLSPKETAESNKQTESKTTAKFNIGDTVVAKWAQNSFYEGKIETVSDAKIKVKWSDGSSPTEVDVADVFTLPKAGAKPEVKVGEIVLAKVASGSYWNGVELTGINGEVYAVKLDNGQTSNISAEKIIKIPADVAANFKQKNETNDFIKEAQTKKPTRPTGYKPKEGEQVLGEWATNSWYQAKVQKISGDKATLAWEDGTKPSEISLEKVLPMPDGKVEMPKDNQFILAKPESGSKWIYAQTVSAKDGKIEIKSTDGKARTIKASDYILLN